MDHALNQFADHVRVRPDDICLTEGDDHYSFAEVATISDNLALDLIAAGGDVGDVMVWIGGAGAARLLAILASQKAGLAFGAPIMQMGSPFIADYMTVCKPRLILAEDGWMDHVPEALRAQAIRFRPDTAPRDTVDFASIPNDVISHLSFTSGSTGMPKGVARNRAAMAYFIREACRIQALGPEDTVGLLGNLWNPTLFTGLVSGARTACFDTPRHGAASLAEWLSQGKVTATMTYPAIFRQIMATGRPLPHLRNIVLIGEPLTLADAEAHAKCTAPDARLLNIYGSMEFAYVTIFGRAAKDPINFRMMPMGKEAAPGVLRLLDESGVEITEDGVVGEIEIVSEHVVPGYLHETSMDTSRFSIRPDGVKTQRTGDLAYRDHAGIYHSMGRRDGQTKIRGYNVRPPEIELILRSLDGVEDATIGAFTAPSGIARLVCHYIGDANPSDLKAALTGTLPDYMVPSLWVNVDAFPRTGTGKVRRIDLPDPFLAASGPRLDEALTDDEAAVRAAFEDILGQTGFSKTDDFFDIGGDSLQAMSLVISLEERFNRRLALDSFIADGASVVSIAARLTAETEAPFVTLRAGGGERTLILTYGVDGHLGPFMEMMPFLDPDLRIIGAHAPKTANGRPGDFPALAEEFLSRIEPEIDGAANVTIMGFSFGAPLALEVVRQLSETGRQTPDLIMIDTLLLWRGLRDQIANLKQRLRNNDRGGAVQIVRQVLNDYGVIRSKSLAGRHTKIFHRYLPKPLAQGRVLYIQGATGFASRSADRWRDCLPDDLTIHRLPAMHSDLMKDPHVGPLAQIIQGWMAQRP